MELDLRVHRFIHGCAGNPYLEETLGRYLNLSVRIWYLVIDRLPHLFARVHEHDDVLHAIAAGDADARRTSSASTSSRSSGRSARSSDQRRLWGVSTTVCSSVNECITCAPPTRPIPLSDPARPPNGRWASQ